MSNWCHRAHTILTWNSMPNLTWVLCQTAWHGISCQRLLLERAGTIWHGIPCQVRSTHFWHGIPCQWWFLTAWHGNSMSRERTGTILHRFDTGSHVKRWSWNSMEEFLIWLSWYPMLPDFDMDSHVKQRFLNCIRTVLRTSMHMQTQASISKSKQTQSSIRKHKQARSNISSTTEHNQAQASTG